MNIMLTLVAQASLAAMFVWLFWKVLRSCVVSSTLDDVPGPPRQSFLLGNIPIFFGREGWGFYDTLRGYGSVARLDGVLGLKHLFVYDPKALQHIFVKNQQSFGQPDWFITYNLASFGPGLLGVQGERHKKQRKMLNPAFSVSQMRVITQALYETAHTLQEVIQQNIRAGAKELDVLGWLYRSALDSVGRGGLGYSFNALHDDKSSEFATALKEFAPAFTDMAVIAPVIQHLQKLGFADFGSGIMGYLPFRTVKQLWSSVNSMKRHSIKIYNEKKDAVTMKNGQGNPHPTNQASSDSDAILSALIRANAEAEAGDRLSDEELIAQMSTLVFAASDTTSNMMSRLLYLLSEHPEVQERLRAEVVNARDGQDISYDRLVQLPYLDAVCKETLRMYPPTPISFRQATQDVLLPLSSPIRKANGEAQHEVLVPKGTIVFIGIQAANRHKEVWGNDADEWKPERWLSPLPQTVLDAHLPGVYSHLMTFLAGPKSCIGFKFAEIEMKVILSVLLASFRFSKSSKEIYWNLSLITFPTIGKTDNKSQLPLVVKPLDEE